MTQKPKDKTSSKKSASDRQRKERVLHTRIPTVLEDELKHLADNLRIPVSNLVRTILQDALHAAEEVGRVAEEELRGAANRLAEERERFNDMAAASGEHLRDRVSRRIPDLEPVDPEDTGPAAEAAPEEPVSQADEPAPSPLDGILGFQELVLAVESRCARCERTLKVGEPAYLGVRDGPGPRVLIGPECLPGTKETDQ